MEAYPKRSRRLTSAAIAPSFNSTGASDIVPLPEAAAVCSRTTQRLPLPERAVTPAAAITTRPSSLPFGIMVSLR